MSDEEANECPICATVPTKKIFQCKEGHIVCESCLRKIQESALGANCLPKCPSCAAPLDDDAVSRCRVLESMMDRLTIDCHHAEKGCQVKLKRGEIRIHEDACMYGEVLDICKIIWLGECSSFRLSVTTADTVFHHIKSSHPTKRLSRSRVTWEFDEIWSKISTGKSKWKYTILQVPKRQKHLLLIIKLSKDLISFSSVDLSLCLAKEDNLRLMISIPNDTSPMLQCSFPVACGIDSWRFLKDENVSRWPCVLDTESIRQHCD